MPLIETFLVTAFGFTVALDNGCQYNFYRVSPEMAIVEVCDEIDHYIINGKYIEV
jgi:hypothetical protein